jgi:phospholipid-binding lipoprotein MlaA
MTFPIPFPFRLIATGCAVAVVAGCAPPAPSGIYDPGEAQNRETHEFNKSLDRSFVGPASGLYGGLPEPVAESVSNFSSNLTMPKDVMNSVLQGRPGPAVENTLRFAINSTIGIGGLFDVATAMGVNGRRTDFGETLHVWGMPEGAYHELPFIGPSTDRDTVGMVADLAANPLGLLLPPPASAVGTVAAVASSLGDRSRFGETIDSVLYDSADSYAQTRLLYLQNRRYELGQTGGADDFVDPYAE